jgi:hypothetical protein
MDDWRFWIFDFGFLNGRDDPARSSVIFSECGSEEDERKI